MNLLVNIFSFFPKQAKHLAKVLVIGSKKGVTSTILTLYRLGFAEVSEWSPLSPASNPGEVMSILTRRIRIN
ncbi:hypothetical protein H6F74_07740 [Trichocoleus sp. FACHB-90]|uniref:hypothetical protein n=1 Tax=Cyanophyceae TaxID=3028117 RepID=UPI0016841990|nr:hypothetical protein [Trichocoleus sp. FACHB-90]MBD1926144.1 hypothetical protein [Trichocoleus sp. FACHB-90]